MRTRQYATWYIQNVTNYLLLLRFISAPNFMVIAYVEGELVTLVCFLNVTPVTWKKIAHGTILPHTGEKKNGARSY